MTNIYLTKNRTLISEGLNIPKIPSTIYDEIKTFASTNPTFKHIAIVYWNATRKEFGWTSAQKILSTGTYTSREDKIITIERVETSENESMV